MPVTFLATNGSIGGGTSISVVRPYNPVGSVMLAWGIMYAIDGISDPVVTTPAGWNLIQENGAFGFVSDLCFCYWKAGTGSSATETFTFNTNIQGNIDIVSYNGINTSTPIKASSFHNTTGGTGHTATAIDTTPLANCMITCGWATVGDNVYFDTNDFSDIRVNHQSGYLQSVEQAMLVGDGVQALAGSTGTKTAVSYGLLGLKTTSAFVILIAIAPAPNPSIPTLTYPNGGESLTAGATAIVTWTPSTSPTAAQSSLEYNLDYSPNNGSSWTSIVALTSAGATSYGWTVPSTTGSGYLIRIRAYDPALAIYSVDYDLSNAAFSVVAETTPGQPVITAPASGSANNKAVNVTVAWVHQGGVGNPQTEFTLQWATNSGFSGATTVGPTATSTQSTSIDFSAQTSGTTIYVKVKTKGLSLYSAYSNTVSFIVASLPATPNITAPTNASPPTVPNPTVTFTEADAFVARKMRVTVAGIETYNSGTVVSTATSFTSPYSFANGIQVVLYLSVQNVYGLWSAEDSETLTPAYTGPATPTITLTANSDAGYIAIAITNSDTPSYNEVWRRQLGQPASDAIQISPSSVAVDGTFTDYGVRSGITYVYFARAVNSGTTLYSTSAEAQASITLKQLVISLPTATGGLSTANALVAVSVINFAAGPRLKQQVVASVKLLGRTSPVPILGETIGGSLAQQIMIPMSQSSLYTSAMAILESGDVICVRDQFGNKIFGKVGQITVTDQNTYWLINFTITDDYHNESATGLDIIPASVAGFIPTDISSCILWLEAENIIGVADGGAVASWPDISGSNNPAVQTDPTKQPILYLDRVNGSASVKFDGTNDTLVTANSLWTGATPRAMFVVYRPVSTGVNRMICGQSVDSGANTTFEVGYLSSGTSNPRVFTPISVIVSASTDDTQWNIVGVTYDGTQLILYWQGITTGVPAVASLNTSTAGFRLGSRLEFGSAVRLWDGEIAAVACFSSCPTLDQLRALTSTWSGKYGIF